MNPIPLVDLRLEPADADASLAAIRRVMERGWFVLGPEVAAFEEELAAACGVEAAVGVGSGTDALILGLLALGIGPGDEVVLPAFTAFPTAAAVMEAGATPVLVDVAEDRPHLLAAATERAITTRTRAVILVHLYGLAADPGPFLELLRPRGIHLVEDCAQAQGAALPDGRPVGSAGAFGALSFYPTKNLGALGDGGALVTADPALADEVRAWRSHGERGARYVHHLPARNSRLDDLHAAVLRLRLGGLPTWVAETSRLSARYASAFDGIVTYSVHRPSDAPHLAVVRVDDPTGLGSRLGELGIGSGRHYPHPLTEQPALAHAPRGDAPNARRWADSCLSIPLHRRLADADVDRVVEAVTSWVGR